jgi:multiple RNA-binding domain-containing protein 1
MQHSSKTRTWANDDIIPAATAPSEPAVVEPQDASQDKSSRPVKKSKVVETETPRQASKTPVQNDTNGEESQPEEGDHPIEMPPRKKTSPSPTWIGFVRKQVVSWVF